jgi:hypothetical protein
MTKLFRACVAIALVCVALGLAGCGVTDAITNTYERLVTNRYDILLANKVPNGVEVLFVGSHLRAAYQLGGNTQYGIKLDVESYYDSGYRYHYAQASVSAKDLVNGKLYGPTSIRLQSNITTSVVIQSTGVYYIMQGPDGTVTTLQLEEDPGNSGGIH